MATNTALRASVSRGNARYAFPKPRHHARHFLSLPKPRLSHATLSATPTRASSSAAAETASKAAAAAETSLDPLRAHLEAGELRLADDETRRLLIALAGEAAQRRGYVFFSEVQYVPAAALRAIDELWRGASGGRFGYSVQKRIFYGKASGDFTRFFIKVGWMKKLDTEVEQFNYRAFPSEFTWDMAEDPPEGHLPLTNALRGTQLLNSIFNHPAFDDVVVEAVPESAQARGLDKSPRASSSSPPTTMKTDYSF